MITVEGGELYVHSNFVTPGYEYPTKIGTSSPETLKVIVANLLFDRSASLDWVVAAEVARNGTFLITRELRESSYFEALKLSDARNVYDISRSGRKTLSPESRSVGVKRRPSMPRIEPRPETPTTPRPPLRLPETARHEIDLAFSSAAARQEILAELRRDLQSHRDTDWRETPTGKRLAGLIANFQSLAHHLGRDTMIDGVGGAQTARRLRTYREELALGEATIEAVIPELRTEVRRLQEALVDHGIPVAVDGRWGRQTDAALAEFQRRHGLEVTGRRDAATRADLAGEPAEPLIEVSPRDLARGFALGERLSRVETLESGLQVAPEVRAFLRIDDTHYVVRVQGIRGWLRIRSASHPSVARLDGMAGKVSDPEHGVQDLWVTPIRRHPLEQGLQPGDYVAFHRAASPTGAPLRLEPIRGPPPSATWVDIHFGGRQPLAAAVLSDGTIAVRRSSLSADLLRHLPVLGQALVAQAETIRQAVATSPGDRAVFTLETPEGYSERAATLFGSGDGTASSCCAWIFRRAADHEVLGETYRLERDGKLDEALELLDARDLSHSPELRIRKALLQSDSGRDARVPAEIERLDRQLDIDAFPELAAQLGESQTGNRGRLSEAVGLYQSESSLGAEKGRVTMEHNATTHELSVGLELPKDQPIEVSPDGRAGAVFRRSSTVYVETSIHSKLSPDGPAAQRSALSAMVRMGDAYVLELSRDSVVQHRPARLEVPIESLPVDGTTRSYLRDDWLRTHGGDTSGPATVGGEGPPFAAGMRTGLRAAQATVQLASFVVPVGADDEDEDDSVSSESVPPATVFLILANRSGDSTDVGLRR